MPNSFLGEHDLAVQLFLCDDVRGTCAAVAALALALAWAGKSSAQMISDGSWRPAPIADNIDWDIQPAAAYVFVGDIANPRESGRAADDPPDAPQRRSATPPAPTRFESNSTARSATRNSDFALGSEQRSLGRAHAPLADAPDMIGDSKIGLGVVVLTTDSGLPLVQPIPFVGSRVKIDENNSPFPVDRVFFNYNHFENAFRTLDFTDPSIPAHAASIESYMPGFEKTFWDGMASIQLQAPLLTTQNPDVMLDGSGDERDTIFGNLTLTSKFLLWQGDSSAFAAGLGVNLPTARDAKVFAEAPSAAPLLIIRNQSMHLLPYLGVLVAPRERLYVQSFLQIDVAANDNDVVQYHPLTNAAPSVVGRLHDQTLMYADIAIGYWLYRDPDAYYVTAVVPTVEFHYTSTLEDARNVVGATDDGLAFALGNLPTRLNPLGGASNRFDVANLTVGSHFQFGPLSRLTVAVVLPLSRSEGERQFDAELAVQLNRFF